MQRAAIAVLSILIAAAAILAVAVLVRMLGPYLVAHPELTHLAPYAGIGVLVLMAPIIARKLQSTRK